MPIGPAVIEVDTSDVRTRAKQILEHGVAQIAIHRRAANSQDRLSAAKISSNSADEIVRQGFHRRFGFDVRRVDHSCFFLGGKCIEHADRPCSDLTSQLAGTDDRGRVRGVNKLSVHEALWWPADSSRVKDLLVTVRRPAADRANVEDVRALDEEWPLLRKKRFVGREIHHGWINFHLTEIGIDGGGKCKPARQTVFEICSRRRFRVVGAIKRIRRIARSPRKLRAGIGHELETTRSRNVDDSGEIALERHEARIGLLPRRPAVTFIPPRHVAHHLKAPDPLYPRRHAAESKLRERNSVLRRPPSRIDRCRDLPHCVPVQVLALVVIVLEDILLHATRIHRESERGAAIPVRVDHHMQPVRVNASDITSRELRGDRVRTRVEHPHADVERVVVVENSHFGRVSWLRSDLGIALSEIARWNSRRPRWLVQLSIDVDGTSRAARSHDPT